MLALMMDMTGCLFVCLLWPGLTATGLVLALWCLFLGLPPIHVSSPTMVPTMVVTRASVFMASRIRWHMNHAVRGHTSYLRSISRAEMPFLLEHISNMTSTHMRRDAFVP